jgi:hypothetical protein
MGAVYDEETGEEVRCPICQSTDDCGHVVAIIDKTFGENHGGSLFDHERDFFGPIEDAFEKIYRSGTKPTFSDFDLGELWDETEFEEDGDDVWVRLNYGGWRFVITLLEDEGAIQPSTSIIEAGGPGMTSSMAYLYHEEPKAVVARAIKALVFPVSAHGTY